MKPNKTISSFRKRLEQFIILLCINMLLSSCYTIHSVSEYTPKTIPGTTKIISFSHYEYEILNKGSNKNLYDINFYEVNNCQGKKNVGVIKRKKKISQKGWGWIYGPTAIITEIVGMWVGSNITNGSDGGMILGGILGAATIFVPAILWHNKAPNYKDVNKLSTEAYKFKEKQILSNSSVKIEYNGKSFTKKTNDFGVLTLNKYDLINNLQINYAENDNQLLLSFYVNDEKVGNNFSIRPSEFLNNYAKVNTTSTKIWSNVYKTKIEGVANIGSEYKITSTYNTNMYCIELVGSKLGYILRKDVNTYYSIEKKSNVKLTIQEYIQDKITKWEKQGEFEHPADYKKRMAKYESKVQEWYAEAVKMYQQQYIDLINWENAEISKYDPNNQTFKVNIPDLDTLIVHVPIEKAREFKENWNNKKIKNQKLDFFSGDWELSSLEIEVPKTYTAKYDNEAVLNYNPITQFNLKFKELNIDVADNTLVDNSKENTQILSYDIKYNLPKTKMSNPDAIAVVIGNANYQYADNVKYALNDGQQIKTYLTNILGFKEENIIFENNASKTEIERIFGTKDNFKGQLYNWVKKDKSDVFIFYSGHGAPGLKDKKGYIVPTDCNPQYLEIQGYSLETLYDNLGNIPSKSTTIVMDACFSGKGVIKNISSITIEPDMPKVFFENGILLTSSTGTEVATWSDEMKQGLFTYFFLKSIHDYKNSDKNGDKQLTIKEIYDYISDESEGIPYFSGRINGFKQHPLISGANEDYVLVKF